MSDMVTKGLMMDIEGCCCRFCMGHNVAMDEHRGLLAGPIWAGWETFFAFGCVMGVIGIISWLVRAMSGG